MPDDTAQRCGLSRGDARVDMWLRRSLTSRFDTVLNEKLPDEWLRMIGPASPGGRDR